MYIILGATGRVGSAVAQTLLDQGQPVTIITRNPKKSGEWERKGARVAITDAHDTDGLRRVFRQGKRLFVLNPPAAPDTDTAQEEQRSVASMLAALADADLEKIVAQSTYGAQPGNRIGDLGVLYEMEQGLARLSVPFSVVRGAYYMSNWDMALQTARQEGKVYTFYPPDFKLPMVAPQDLGRIASQLLMEPVSQTGLCYAEGPELYSSADVAAAFAEVLGKSVEAVEISREQWIPTLKEAGFSQAAAESMAAMTAMTLEQKPEMPDSPIRGTTTLREYMTRLVREHQMSSS